MRILWVSCNFSSVFSVSSVAKGVIQSVVKSAHVSNIVIPGLTRNPVDKPSLYKEYVVHWILVPAFAGINLRGNDGGEFDHTLNHTLWQKRI